MATSPIQSGGAAVGGGFSMEGGGLRTVHRKSGMFIVSRCVGRRATLHNSLNVVTTSLYYRQESLPRSRPLSRCIPPMFKAAGGAVLATMPNSNFKLTAKRTFIVGLDGSSLSHTHGLSLERKQLEPEWLEPKWLWINVGPWDWGPPKFDIQHMSGPLLADIGKARVPHSAAFFQDLPWRCLLAVTNVSRHLCRANSHRNHPPPGRFAEC